MLNNRFTSTKGYKGEIGTSIDVGVKEAVSGEGSLCLTKSGPLETPEGNTIQTLRAEIGSLYVTRSTYRFPRHFRN